MRRILFFIWILLALFFPLSAYADEIKNYDVHIQLQKDASFTVQESIQYVFDTEHHGIFRDIPVTVNNVDNKQYRLTLTNFQVGMDGVSPYPFIQSTSGNSTHLKIGHADSTVSGEHIYDISYTVQGGMRYFSDHDELYWNAVGTSWKVPIRMVQVTVAIPEGSPILNGSSCYVGIQGSPEPCLSKSIATPSAYFAHNNLSLGQGFTISVPLPKGVIAQVEPQPYNPIRDALFSWQGITSILGGSAFLIALAWAILTVPRPKTVSAWFDPPKTPSGRPLTPAETGTLVDGNTDGRDLTALIVGLAQKGYITIREEEQKGFLSQKKIFVVTRASNTSRPLTTAEQSVLDSLLGSSDSFTFDGTYNATLHSLFVNSQQSLSESLHNEGIFTTSPGNILLPFFLIPFAITFIAGLLGLVPIALMGFAVTFASFGIFMLTGQFRRALSKSGLEALGYALSLRNFLKSQERQLNFMGDKQMLFEKLLPYAVAFGVEKHWMKRFGDYNLQNPTWYTGTHPGVFSMHDFTDSMQSFSSSISSTGMSSGSSGSGSSGGGGGGGGGGSW